MKKVYGYARVSTTEQHLDRQLKALLDFGIEERDIVTDKSSGMSMDREGYQMLKTRLLRDLSLIHIYMRIVMSLTVEIDVTRLLEYSKSKGLKFYPSMIWALSTAYRNPKPVTASILLTPAATELSDTILKSPSSPVFFTWVPPQSSME